MLDPRARMRMAELGIRHRQAASIGAAQNQPREVPAIRLRAA
jgi:hypothetical protein